MVRVVVKRIRNKLYTVQLVRGVQSFLFNYVGTKDECRWYAKMVRIALKKNK